jgi:hypothetical protein
MTTRQSAKLTDEQAARMGEDTRNAMDLAHRQLSEYKEKLAEELSFINMTEMGLSPSQFATLYAQVAEIRMEQVLIEPARKEGEKQTVSTIWGYPDELHEFLHRPEFKSPFNLLTDDKGITLGQDVPAIKA